MGVQASKEFEREQSLSLAQVRALCGENDALFDMRLFHLLQDADTGRVRKADVLDLADVLFRFTFRGRTRVCIKLNVGTSQVEYVETNVSPSAEVGSPASVRTIGIAWPRIRQWLGTGMFPDTPWDTVCPALFEMLMDDTSSSASSSANAEVGKPVGPPKGAVGPPKGHPGNHAGGALGGLANLNWSKPKSTFSLWRFKLTPQCRLELALLVAGHVNNRLGNGAGHAADTADSSLPPLELDDKSSRCLDFHEAVRCGDAVMAAVLQHLIELPTLPSQEFPAKSSTGKSSSSSTTASKQPPRFRSLNTMMDHAAQHNLLDVAHVLYGLGASFTPHAAPDVLGEYFPPVTHIENNTQHTLVELGLPDEEALIEAVEGNIVDEVALLAALGTNLNCRDARERSLFALAGLYGSTEFARHLLRQFHFCGYVPTAPFAPPKSQQRFNSARPVFPLRELFHHGGDFDFTKSMNPSLLNRPQTRMHVAQAPDLQIPCIEGMTALMQACLDANRELVKLQLAYAVNSGGAVPRADEYIGDLLSCQESVFGGATAAHIIIQQKQYGILRDVARSVPHQQLTRCLELSDRHRGYTPLQVAVINDDAEAVDILIRDAHVNVENAGKVGLSPILVACQHVSEKSAALLLELGDCDPNPTSSTLGIVAQSAAIDKKISDTAATQGSSIDEREAELLLQEERLAALSKVTIGGSAPELTPVQVAVHFGSTTIVEKLIARKADLSVLDDRGNTLPMIAAINSSFMLLKLLVESGVDLEQTNNEGLTLSELINKHHNVTLGEGIAVRVDLLPPKSLGGWWLMYIVIFAT